MSRFQKFLIGLAIVVLVGYAFIKLTYPTCTFRYKLTAEVMTPDGPKTGSGVIEVSYTHFFSLSGVPNLIHSVTGEAIFVDLGNNKNFFVTLTSWESGRNTNLEPSTPSFSGALGPLNLPIKVFKLTWPSGRGGEESTMAKQVEALEGSGPVVVPPVFLPTLVTFRNVNDPDSVEVVRPDNFAKTFGPGFELVKATLQLTDEPPTETIEGTLPWLKAKKIEWEKIRSRGKGDALIILLNYDAFKEPGIWEGTL
ncbi:MAG: hypothetical protein Q8L53_05565 [Aestuariivirga sp.]|nr:hypothetical protein [Aestuariivirga sp.]